MQLNQLKDNLGARKSRMRVGRGIGSGKGKTSGRGVKGYGARSGCTIGAFEGGQTPLYRRLPKRGFNNIFRVAYEPVNLGYIQRLIDEKKIDAGALITKKVLVEVGLLRNERLLVKLLSKGDLKDKVAIEADAASQSAIERVQKAGGSVTLLAAAQGAAPIEA